MASTQTSNFDRFNETLRGLDEQVQELRDRFDDRRKEVGTEIRKRAQEVETRLRKSPIYRRAERARKDVETQVDKTRAQIFEALGLATRADLDKLNRRVNAISKKIGELAKEQQFDV